MLSHSTYKQGFRGNVTRCDLMRYFSHLSRYTSLINTRRVRWVQCSCCIILQSLQRALILRSQWESCSSLDESWAEMISCHWHRERNTVSVSWVMLRWSQHSHPELTVFLTMSSRDIQLWVTCLGQSSQREGHQSQNSPAYHLKACVRQRLLLISGPWSIKDHVMTMLTASNDRDDSCVVVVGSTGTGKSSTIARVGGGGGRAGAGGGGGGHNPYSL